MPLKRRRGYQFIAMAAIAYFLSRRTKLESQLLFYRKVSKTETLDTIQNRPLWVYASSSVLLGQSIRKSKQDYFAKMNVWSSFQVFFFSFLALLRGLTFDSSWCLAWTAFGAMFYFPKYSAGVLSRSRLFR